LHVRAEPVDQTDQWYAHSRTFGRRRSGRAAGPARTAPADRRRGRHRAGAWPEFIAARSSGRSGAMVVARRETLARGSGRRKAREPLALADPTPEVAQHTMHTVRPGRQRRGQPALRTSRRGANPLDAGDLPLVVAVSWSEAAARSSRPAAGLQQDGWCWPSIRGTGRTQVASRAGARAGSTRSALAAAYCRTGEC